MSLLRLHFLLPRQYDLPLNPIISIITLYKLMMMKNLKKAIECIYKHVLLRYITTLNVSRVLFVYFVTLRIYVEIFDILYDLLNTSTLYHWVRFDFILDVCGLFILGCVNKCFEYLVGDIPIFSRIKAFFESPRNTASFRALIFYIVLSILNSGIICYCLFKLIFICVNHTDWKMLIIMDIGCDLIIFLHCICLLFIFYPLWYEYLLERYKASSTIKNFLENITYYIFQHHFSIVSFIQ